jgi:hypothetical protein
VNARTLNNHKGANAMLTPEQKKLEIKYDNWLNDLQIVRFDFEDSLKAFEQEFDIKLPMSKEFELALEESFMSCLEEDFEIEE